MKPSHLVLDLSRKVLGGVEFTIQHGIAKGHKRRFGLGFVPSWKETKEDQFLRSKDFAGQTIFDIGAYVGLYTTFFSNRAGPSGKVIAFEPNPMNFAELNHNLRLNGFNSTKTMMVAVADKPGKLEMGVSPYLTSRGSLDEGWQGQFRNDVKKITVDVVTIDELVEKGTIPKPDFVKIDVEAFEVQVLKGMQKTLTKYHPTLWVEIHGPLTKELLETICPHGYDVTHFELGQKVHPQYVPQVVHGHLYCVYNK